MDEFLDALWLKILAGLDLGFELATRLLAPLNFMGPALSILLIIVALVAFTKTISRLYTTRRYQKLKENYEHWFEVRRQALATEDPDKGKALAKNIDQAELNKAYYDFFFEGFLKNIVTTILPVLLTAAFVAKAYSPANLVKHFGQPHVFNFVGTSGKPVTISAFFWFVICLVAVHILWFIAARVYRHYSKSGSRKES